jgi:tetratricopeptide (TPR) repeat protein
MKILAAVVLAIVAGLVPAGTIFADPGGNAPAETQPDARRFYEQGVEHSKNQRWPQAIQAYVQAVRLEPRFVEAWTNLGYAYRKVNDNNRSLDAYKRALDINSNYAAAHEYVGRLYIAMGNKEMAMRHYEILRRLDAKLAAELLRAIEANNADYGP